MKRLLFFFLAVFFFFPSFSFAQTFFNPLEEYPNSQTIQTKTRSGYSTSFFNYNIFPTTGSYPDLDISSLDFWLEDIPSGDFSVRASWKCRVNSSGDYSDIIYSDWISKENVKVGWNTFQFSEVYNLDDLDIDYGSNGLGTYSSLCSFSVDFDTILDISSYYPDGTSEECSTSLCYYSAPFVGDFTDWNNIGSDASARGILVVNGFESSSSLEYNFDDWYIRDGFGLILTDPETDTITASSTFDFEVGYLSPDEEYDNLHMCITTRETFFPLIECWDYALTTDGEMHTISDTLEMTSTVKGQAHLEAWISKDQYTARTDFAFYRDRYFSIVDIDYTTHVSTTTPGTVPAYQSSCYFESDVFGIKSGLCEAYEYLFIPSSSAQEYWRKATSIEDKFSVLDTMSDLKANINALFFSTINSLSTDIPEDTTIDVDFGSAQVSVMAFSPQQYVDMVGEDNHTHVRNILSVVLWLLFSLVVIRKIVNVFSVSP
jgi:hypothetical protein